MQIMVDYDGAVYSLSDFLSIYWKAAYQLGYVHAARDWQEGAVSAENLQEMNEQRVLEAYVANVSANPCPMPFNGDDRLIGKPSDCGSEE